MSCIIEKGLQKQAFGGFGGYRFSRRFRSAITYSVSPGTRTQPSINTRALRLMIAFFTTH